MQKKMMDLQNALIAAHDALNFLGKMKLLVWDDAFSTFENAVAIAASEIWASGKKPKTCDVANLLNVCTEDGVSDIESTLDKLRALHPAWEMREQPEGMDVFWKFSEESRTLREIENWAGKLGWKCNEESLLDWIYELKNLSILAQIEEK